MNEPDSNSLTSLTVHFIPSLVALGVKIYGIYRLLVIECTLLYFVNFFVRSVYSFLHGNILPRITFSGLAFLTALKCNFGCLFGFPLGNLIPNKPALLLLFINLVSLSYSITLRRFVFRTLYQRLSAITFVPATAVDSLINSRSTSAF